MKKVLPIVALMLVLLGQNLLAQSAKSHPYVVIGYVTGSGWTKDQIEAQKLTHINYAFGVPDEKGEIAPLTAKDGENLAKLTSLRANNKDLKILLSIGGWGGCKYFSDAALNEASRQKFTNSAVAILKKHQLDGIDTRLGIPRSRFGAGNIYPPRR